MTRSAELTRAAGVGAVAGLIGVAAMTLGEVLEQRITGRPDSYIPARTLQTLLGRATSEESKPAGWNHAMHWTTGAVLGALRGVWAVTGLRGGQANVLHTATRLAFDQTLENVTGAGAAPATWPTQELAVDVGHKAVYSTVTGLVADRWLAPVLVSTRGRISH